MPAISAKQSMDNSLNTSRPLRIPTPPSQNQWLWWCIPALLLALGLRIALLAEWPRAFYWPDSKDALFTAKRWFENYSLSLHYKKAWLPPVVYAFGCYLPGGLLSWAAWIQHAIGVGCVFLAGGICRTWFVHWRWWILPVTIFIAVNPSMIIWEHSIMQEPWFMPALLGAAWTVGLFVHSPSWRTFRWLAFSLYMCASTRPEGKLFMAVGFLAVLLVWFKNGPNLRKGLLAMLGVSLLATLTSQKGQAGLLLLTSVVKFTPDEMTKFPGLAENLKPIREGLINSPTVKGTIPTAKTRGAVSDAVKTWLATQGQKNASDTQINKTSLKIAKHICLRNLPELPAWAWLKFRRVAFELPSCSWDEKYIIDDQIEGLSRDRPLVSVLGKNLFGTSAPASDQTERWILDHTKMPPKDHWMTQWERWWGKYPLAWRTAEFPESPEGPPLPGVPWFKLIAALGLVVSVLGTCVQCRVQWTFAPVLAGVMFVVLLTANIKPRFLFLFEPFWILYLMALADSCVRFITAGLHKLFRRRKVA